MDRKGAKRKTRSPGQAEKPRKFRGNQHTAEKNTEFVSTSADKIKNQGDFDVSFSETANYVLLSFNLVFTALQSMIKCKLCNSDIQFLKKSPQGLGFKLCVKCSCQELVINSCPMIKNAYEVNRRFTFVMRLLGVGLAGINVFCSLMDLGTGFSKSGYYYIIDQIYIAVKAVVETVFKKAVNEEKEKNAANGFPEDEITVSGDGSWAKRGFTSLLGIISLIGKFKNKIVDVIVKSKVCKACEKWVGKEETDEYLEWYENHAEECTANHEGSSGGMEVDGVIEMFQRSVQCFAVKYKKYIGDGDSKTFKNLLEADVYNGNPVVVKKECVLHVKKRMFRRVKEAKKALTQLLKAKKQIADAEKKEAEKKIKVEEEATGVKTSSTKKRRSAKNSSASKKEKVKTLSLTNKIMVKLSTYYGLAILRNPDSRENMKKAVWATYYHMISTNERPQHSYCPEGPDSWCAYQKHQLENNDSRYEHPPAFDEDTASILKPIYEELSSDDLLERCLGKNTQNNNESFNHCVWNFAPKHLFVGKKILEIATWTAACIFNEGFMPVLKIMEVMGVQIGVRAVTYAEQYNTQRIERAEKATSEAAKATRISRRAEKVAENDAYEEVEGLLYAPGIDD